MHSVQIVCFGHIIDIDIIKKRIICRSYPCYWDEKINYEINYRVSIDFFNLGTYKSIDEAKIRAFDLTFSPKKYKQIINKAQKSFYKHITNSIHWRKSDESNAYRIYERGGYFARIHLYQDQYILELKHRNLSFYIPGTKKQHYTKIGDFENEASAMEKAYSLFCTPIELEPLLLRDPYIYFMDSRNWNIINDSLDREIHKNVLSDIDIEICKKDLWRFTMKIGSLQGNKTFRSIEKAKEIAYDFITAGKYSKFVKAHT